MAFVYQKSRQVKKPGPQKASWYVGWEEPDGHRCDRSFGAGAKGKKDALEFRRRIEADLLKGTYRRRSHAHCVRPRFRQESAVSASRITRKRLNAETARRYPPPPGAPPDDALLNVSAICLDFQLNNSTFYFRQEKGWPGLRGKSLTPYQREWGLPGKEKHLENTYLRSEVQKALSDLPEGISLEGRNRFRVKDAHGGPDQIRVTFDQARSDLGGIAWDTMKRYALKGWIEFHKWEPWTGFSGRWCTEKALNDLKSKKIEAEALSPHGPTILMKEAMKLLRPLWRKRYGAGRRLSKRSLFRWHWEGCLYLCGFKIRLVMHHGRPTWCLKEDIDELATALGLPRGHYRKRINGNWTTVVGSSAKVVQYKRRFRKLASRDGQALGRGPGTSGMRTGITMDKLPLLRIGPSTFDGTYPDGRVNLTKGSIISGYPRSFLETCTRTTSYLPEGYLPSLKQEVPKMHRRRYNEECTVLPADLIRLKTGILEAARIKVPPGFKDAAHIARLAGARDKTCIIFIWARLKEGRASGAITAWRPDKPIPIRGDGRGKRRTWFYKIGEALDYIRNGPGLEQNGADEAGKPQSNPTRDCIDGTNGQSPNVQQGHRTLNEAGNNSQAERTTDEQPKPQHKRRGPHKKEITKQVEDFCLKARKDGGRKRRTMAREVMKEFGLEHFAETSVTTYARRAAERQRKAWPIKKR
jgi:hypothetical protein